MEIDITNSAIISSVSKLLRVFKVVFCFDPQRGGGHDGETL